MDLILWLVIAESANPIRNLVVAKTRQRAKELAKGMGYKTVHYVCETSTYDEEKLIRYF